MKDSYKRVKDLLEKQVKARERSNKNLAIAVILRDSYPQLDGISAETIRAIVKDANNHDRSWRKVLEDCPELRGSDYDKKTELEQAKQIELGYGSNLHRDAIR